MSQHKSKAVNPSVTSNYNSRQIVKVCIMWVIFLIVLYNSPVAFYSFFCNCYSMENNILDYFEFHILDGK